MYRFDALIFDVDGTLAETERDGHRVAFNTAFAEAGLDWEWSPGLYGELLAVSGGKERIRRFVADRGPGIRVPEDFDGFVAELHRRKNVHYAALLRSGAVQLRPGILRLLRQARAAGKRLAIATTTTAENVETLLECSEESGLVGWFEVIAAGDMVEAKKPAPEIYLLALAKLGLPAAACIAVEDSDNGVRAALGAGLRALLVTVSSYTRGQDFSGAAAVVDGLGAAGNGCKVIAGGLQADGQVNLAVLDAMHQRVYGGGSA